MRGRHAAQTVVGVNRLMNPFDPIDQNILRAIEEVQKISNLADRNWKRTADMISTIDFERIVRLTEEQMKVIDHLEEQSKWLSRAGPGAVAVARSNYNRIIDDVLRTIEPTALSLTNASVWPQMRPLPTRDGLTPVYPNFGRTCRNESRN